MADHRAGRHDAAPSAQRQARTPQVTRPAGKRRADPSARVSRVRAHRGLLPIRPVVPSLFGAAILVVAGGGAVSAGGETQGSPSSVARPTVVGYASVLSGSSAIATSSQLADRERAVSRDSQREALQDAAEEDLQEAAEAQARERNAALAQLATSAEQHAAELVAREKKRAAEAAAGEKRRAVEVASNLWVLPLDSYELTASFGQSSGLWANTHTGLDFAAASGAPIKSVANGVVTSTEYDGSYGNKTVVTLEDGTEIWYCHQTAFAVSPGDQVSSGQVIGSVGTTGNSTGPHLHLEVRPGAGDPVDPFNALRVRGLNP